MKLIRWTLISGLAGTLAMCAAAVPAMRTPHLYVITVGALGVMLAPVQGWLLPARLQHERRAWTLYGVIAALGGTVVLWGADWYLDDIIGGAGFGVVVGVMGWAIIRDSIHAAWRWIPLNAFAYAVVALTVLLTKTLNRLYRAYDATLPLPLMVGLLAVGAFTYAWLSGVGMRVLLNTQADGVQRRRVSRRKGKKAKTQQG